MDTLSFLKAQRANARLDGFTLFDTVAAAANTYTLNMGGKTNKNFAIETADGAAKTIAFTGLATAGVLTVSLKLKFTNNAAISHPVGVVWQNGSIPTFTVGRTYLISYISYDGGTTWLGFCAGAW
jgi:VCBS repeat-containing protein